MIYKDRIFLVGVHSENTTRDFFQESMEELRRLAETAGAEIIATFIQNLEKPFTSTYIGSGKIDEISRAAQKNSVNTLVFNNNLSPSQSRNISDLSGCNVVDRTEIILAIFARHARTKQAKLQVELAQLEYSYTRLKHMWKHLSRIEGGIGFRGPGEKQLEVDRREIRKKISFLKQKLANIEKTAVVKRNKRKKLMTISLVGYTNAGKSTIFNFLTNEHRYIADQLFATLDSLSRYIITDSKEKCVVTDTIGFIRNLPHKLVASFHSTLLEVIEADLILHVVDISNPYFFDQINAVDQVLEELGASNKNTLYVFNKTDKVRGHYYSFLKKKILHTYPDSIFISAKTGKGTVKLKEKIDEFLIRSKKTDILEIPLKMKNLIDFIHNNADVIEMKLDKKSMIQRMEVKIPRNLLKEIKQQILNFKLKEYINK